MEAPNLLSIDGMAFIVIEALGGAEYAIIVTDENGFNKVFETEEEAVQESWDCQDAVVVRIH